MRFGNLISDPSLWRIRSGGCFTVSFTRTRIIFRRRSVVLDFMAPRHPGAKRFVRRYLLRHVNRRGQCFRVGRRFHYSAGSGSNHGHHRREVVSEGGDVIRIRIIFWSVLVIELLEQLQISPA